MQDTVMKSIVNGVYILTVQQQGRVNGATVAWVTQVSHDPLLIMVSLAGVRFSHDMVKQSGYFGLSVLSQDQVALARDFGFKTGRDTNKFEGVGYSASDQGLPILDDACAYIECRLVSTFPAGDHTLLVGEVVEARTLKDDARPLVFRKEDYF